MLAQAREAVLVEKLAARIEDTTFPVGPTGSVKVRIFVDYERSPEARYPTAIEQAFASILYVAEHADALGVDASRLAIFGDNLGGNMSAALMLMVKERQGPRFALQVLFYPVTDANFETESYNKFADGPWLTRKAMQWSWDAYLPEQSQRSKPTASPLRAILEQLQCLPALWWRWTKMMSCGTKAKPMPGS